MKKTKKALSLFLAVLMLLSCLSMTAFAQEPEDAPAFDSYLCVGTSVTRGCGLPGYDDFNEETVHRIDGSYPALVADALGIPAENCWNCSYQGQITPSILSIMGLFDPADDSFLSDATWFGRARFPYMVEQFDSETGTYSILDKLATCDLITLEVGMGDVFYRTKEVLFNDLDTADTEAFITGIIEELYNNYDRFMSGFPQILNYIKANNPDATVVIIGAYNMVADMGLNEEIYAPVGDAFALLSASMNVYQKNLAKQYGYLFADISNVDTPGTESDLTFAEIEDMNAAVHPSIENGLPFIARQVLNALDSVNKFATTNIILDLGAIDHVDYVLVDSRPIENYVIEGHTLIIPYYNGSAKLLTLGVANDGVLAAHSYQLSFGENGYTAYKIGAINDTFSYAQKLFKTIFELIQSLWTKILDLFGIAR